MPNHYHHHSSSKSSRDIDNLKVKDERSSPYRSTSKHESRQRSGREIYYERSKPKKDRKRRSRTRSLSSSSSYNDMKFDKALDEKRLQKIKDEKERKRHLKELETPDEKRARRIAKKLQKEEHRRAEALNAFPEGIPYTDLNNPFNDNTLTEAFVWKKKWETQGKPDISRKKVEKISRETIAKNFAEMEQLKKNREAREAVREDMEMIARDQDRRQCDWNKTEDVFHLQQAKLRSSIRIKEGRAKPIDYLGRYISYMDESNEEEFELNTPLTYFPNDSIDDYEDLIADIKIYRVIDGGKNKSYWDDVEIIAKSTLKKLRENRRRSNDGGVMHSLVQEEVLKIFKGKSYNELGQLEDQIQAKINNISKGTDVSYWESLLDELRPFMAKQRLKELHAKMQQMRLRKIREEQIKEMGVLEEQEEKMEAPKIDMDTTSAIALKEEEEYQMEVEETMIESGNDKTEIEITKEQQPTPIDIPFQIGELLKMEDEQREQAYQLLETKGILEQFALASYEYGRYSPKYGNVSNIMPGIEILDETEDSKILQESRAKNKRNESGEQLDGEEHMIDIAKKGMTNDEVQFSVEETLEKQHFLWSDKYRPRKPRYFNRVHTGYDWNKYNQTHYDIDNPPPKIVQGYRFNIFYPDLLDPTKTPTFTLTRCEDTDFAILRFRAGPPYEDIAFKIVNREWEVSYKHGYKCQFQNHVFQLWFFFKRYRYRR